MANCTKDTEIQVLGAGGTLIKNIRLSNDQQRIVLFRISDGTEICSNSIDSSAYLGVELVNEQLIFRDAISGLNGNNSFILPSDVLIELKKTDSSLYIIGVEDDNVSFVVPKMNIRYDASTNSIQFQI